MSIVVTGSHTARDSAGLGEQDIDIPQAEDPWLVDIIPCAELCLLPNNGTLPAGFDTSARSWAGLAEELDRTTDQTPVRHSPRRLGHG
jgi:hypothetical protein